MVGKNYGIKINTDKKVLLLDFNNRAIKKSGSIRVEYNDGIKISLSDWVIQGKRHFWNRKINTGFLIEGDSITIEGNPTDSIIDIHNGDIFV